jgi:hypothetical protein
MLQHRCSIMHDETTMMRHRHPHSSSTHPPTAVGRQPGKAFEMASTAMLTTARAAALFTSTLSISADPTRAEATAAIRHAIRQCGGARGCAAEMAATYGDYPEIAVPRMGWARGAVATAYPKSPMPLENSVRTR